MKIFFDDIEAQRRSAGPFVVGLIWIMIPVIAVESLAAAGGAAAAALGAIFCAAIATAATIWMGTTSLGRSLSSVALMGQVSIMVAKGAAWQVDMHMAYFAALALTIVYADWIAILAAALTVAVHHLVLSFLIPLAVFPDSASLGRVVLHAVILIVEAGALMWVAGNLNNIFGASARALALAERASEEARELNRAEGLRHADALAEREANRSRQAASLVERERVANAIGVGLARLSAKDLTYRMPSDAPDADRALQTDFNGAIGQLEQALRDVTGGVAAIEAGTQGIASASQDLTRRTAQQSASLGETAAALDEITATVKKSSEGATLARQVVAAADDDARKSAVVVRQAVEAMDAIAKSAQQISQIIGVIDEIAFQTNLLALNAGVEAARAGDAGRGFAVVASEVRALAQRSAEAAKEIKGLISASTTQVDAGVKLVAETGKSLERIMAQVSEINTVFGEIAAGAQEQASGLQQVNTAINQMDQATQQNAAMVEQTTAAAHSLSLETEQLSGLIGQFQVGRASDDGSMRRALQKAAPHAFRPPAANPAARPGRPETRKTAPPARTAPKAVVNGAAEEGWEEF